MRQGPIVYQQTTQPYIDTPKSAAVQETLPFGFIVTRRVCNIDHDKLWRECVRNIRRCYPYVPIVVIDDHSTHDYSSSCGMFDPFMDGLIVVVKSDLPPGCGELLPYIYMHRKRYFHKAVILHDSVFLHVPFAPQVIENVNTVRYLWGFDEQETHFIAPTKYLLTLMNIDPEIYTRKEWEGCFGTMCIITLSFLEQLMTRYPLYTLVPLMHGRLRRMCLERVFAIACFMMLRNDTEPSIHGNIVNFMRYGLSYDEYKQHETVLREKYPIIKVWNSR